MGIYYEVLKCGIDTVQVSNGFPDRQNQNVSDIEIINFYLKQFFVITNAIIFNVFYNNIWSY